MTAKAGEAIRRRTGLRKSAYFPDGFLLGNHLVAGQFELGGLEAGVQFDGALEVGIGALHVAQRLAGDGAVVEAALKIRAGGQRNRRVDGRAGFLVTLQFEQRP